MRQSVKHIKRVYFGIVALNWLSVAIPLPIFVLFMQGRGVDLFQLGIIMGVYSIVIVDTWPHESGHIWHTLLRQVVTAIGFIVRKGG